MNNKLINYKETFLSKLKKFFQNIFSIPKKESENIQSINQNINHYEKTQPKVNSQNYIKNINKVSEQQHNNQEKYKKTFINGKEIRYSENDNNGKITKRFVCLGEKEATYITSNDYQEKSFTLFGYTNSNVNGLGFNEKVRNKDLDLHLYKKTQNDLQEIISSGPLLNLDNDLCSGRYKRSEYIYNNGKRSIEYNREFFNDNGDICSINETHEHNNNQYIHTKYLNGRVVFQLIRDEKGTIIKDYDTNGNVKDAYVYDNEGNPTETIEVAEKNGTISTLPKVFPGIDYIPDENIDFSKGISVLNNEYESYSNALEHAGLPQNIINMLDSTYERHIPNSELKDFVLAKDQLNKQNQTKTQINVKENQEEYELG